ncbi:hypothetical protein EDC04DRAFT_2605222 [Pisolithus marmoratus]|nr:hypothetical protein EDC04DRAFT_2605222 [Pisolithus marmoratus]
MSHVGNDDDLSEDDFDLDNVSNDTRDSESDTSDLEEMRRTLAISQKAYMDVQTELHSIRKGLATLSSAIPAHKHNHVLNKTETVNSNITKEAKKYVMLYSFWLTDGVFPLTSKPDVDPCSPSHWTSHEARVEGMRAKLYSVIPKSLHEVMAQYPCFGSVYKLDLSMLSTQDPCKQTDPKFQSLLMRNNEYTWLMLVLFKNHELMVPNEFLKSPVVVSVMENVNCEVFSSQSKWTNEDSPSVSSPLSHTWEDDLLEEMENETSSTSPTPANAMNLSLTPTTSHLLSPISGTTATVPTSVSSTGGNSVEVGQLSISNNPTALPKSTSASSSHSIPASWRISPLLAHPPNSTSSSTSAQPEPAKQMTCGHPTKPRAKT